MPEVGRWAIRKYHFLGRYLDLFSTGMKVKWRERHFIDLFAGAGFARIRDTGRIVRASPILAASVRDPFTALHLCERDQSKCAALRQRLSVAGYPASHIHHGDANELVGTMLASIPRKGALCLTFVDPYGLHFDFETAKELSTIHSDLIILFADNMDALRNWAMYYYNDPQSNLDRFMGESGWRDLLTRTTTGANAAERLRTRYQERLRSLGYEHFAAERVRNDQGNDLYSLIFASRHKRGLDFWQKASAVDETGQRGLFSSD